MSRPVPLAAVLALISLPASARERVNVFDVPKTNPVVAPIAAPNLNLSLNPALNLTVVQAAPQLNATLTGKVITAQTLAPVAAPTVNTSLALPQSAVPRVQTAVEVQGFFKGEPMLPASDSSSSDNEQSFEQGAADARRLFDGAATKAERLEALPAALRGTPELEGFSEARKQAKEGGYTVGRAQALVDKAEAVYKKLGVAVERVKNGKEPGLRIVAKKGVSDLNDLAFDAFKAFGTTLDYLPATTANSTALFMMKENRVALSDPDEPDYYLGLLHELRHAWYSHLLQKGDVRLFHLNMYARPGMRIAPQARVYGGYMNFEELSTFPKTLKHMVAELERLEPKLRKKVQKSLDYRLLTYAELLKSADYLGEMLYKLRRRMPDLVGRLDSSDYKRVSLRRSPAVDWFEVQLPQGSFFIPSPKREKRHFLGIKTNRGKHDEAAERVLLSMELISQMSEDVKPVLREYAQAVEAQDWKKANQAADKMIARAAAAEKAWSDAQPK